MKYIIQSNPKNRGEHWGDSWSHESEHLSLEFARDQLVSLKKRDPIVQHRIVTQELVTTVIE